MEQEIFNRDFKGVWIPKEVWLDERLSALDKIILTEIDSLDQGEEGCFASNEYIAQFCQCSQSKISKSISKLIECNYIYIYKFDGRKRHLKSRLTKNTNQTSKIYESDSQNLRHINTSNNTINNNKKNNNKKTKFIPPTLEEVKQYCKERNNNVDAEYFYNYFSVGNWVDSKGNKVKNWKQKIITWERYNTNDNTSNDTFIPKMVQDEYGGFKLTL